MRRIVEGTLTSSLPSVSIDTQEDEKKDVD